MTARTWAAVALVSAVPLFGGRIAGQSLADRVAQVRTGTVRFHFDAKPDVEVCDQGIRMGPQRHIQWHSSDWSDEEGTHCHSGFLEVELSKRAGKVRDVTIVKRLDDRSSGATELGQVDADSAARLLLAVARTTPPRRATERAMLLAALANAEGVWRDFMALAKDRSLPEALRKSALFWVSQEASDVVTQGLADVATADDENQRVRNAAVFALSQRPDSEAVPALMELARTAAQARTRKAALFWLAQSDDPRVLPFFEEILVGKPGG